MTQEPLTLWSLVQTGGWTMLPLFACSIITVVVVLERMWYTRYLQQQAQPFHLAACNQLLRNDLTTLRAFCQDHRALPHAEIILVALDKIMSEQQQQKQSWRRALDRKQSTYNYALKQSVWLLGTIASSAPFIGLFGTVVGILQAFYALSHAAQMSQTSSFQVVSAAISEALIATAFGVLVAVVAIIAYNALQVRLGYIIATLRVQMDEIKEMLSDVKGVE